MLAFAIVEVAMGPLATEPIHLTVKLASMILAANGMDTVTAAMGFDESMVALVQEVKGLGDATGESEEKEEIVKETILQSS